MQHLGNDGIPPPGGELGRVQRGQTLSQLAAGMDRGGRSLDEAMVAPLRANPQAFIGGNIHHLRAGARLRMPGPEDFGKADAPAASQSGSVCALTPPTA